MNLTPAHALLKRAGRMTEPPLEASREIELIAKLELRGDFLDRVLALVQQCRRSIDA